MKDVNLKVYSTPNLPAITPKIDIFRTLPIPDTVLYIPTAVPLFLSLVTSPMYEFAEVK